MTEPIVMQCCKNKPVLAQSETKYLIAALYWYVCPDCQAKGAKRDSKLAAAESWNRGFV